MAESTNEQVKRKSINSRYKKNTFKNQKDTSESNETLFPLFYFGIKSTSYLKIVMSYGGEHFGKTGTSIHCWGRVDSYKAAMLTTVPPTLFLCNW